MAASDATFWIGRRSAASSRLPCVLRLLVSGEGSIFLASRTAARRCGVTQATAAADLAALVRDGRLGVTGAGTKRRYVARLS